jgi:hypothetical protein
MKIFLFPDKELIRRIAFNREENLNYELIRMRDRGAFGEVHCWE